ncbi:cytochrome b [Mesorhizobium sp.]|uniref:cytochrome b n=1 Tax=Mesorhizobium sp. TaxID=1871066 RepID=UPI000FE3EBF7|nr:cytochrome b [Mesorhizobium sp.]RWG76624.1 MAG: cytochrome b [Mesorhizobium sp.]RWG79862.1 MAG: cytochrome b [Mesorhizobium sp.]RWK02920.1 MAG: cytochrome b [Mesorhizobium sp.]RWK11700.1 MAG: cytochrome b [Mesorhizobium sp.]RWK14480.1 MAG: cytochrome b [Mesorhizobium sp.]
MAAITTYTSSQKFLHWALFALVVLLYGLTFGEEFYPRGDPAVDAIWRLHISFGLLLAAFVLWRVVLRGVKGAPELPAEMSPLEQTAAKVGHFALYALLVALPVLGILLTWFRGDSLSFFGLFTVPAPFAADRATARTIRELHELCANGILIVAGVHALAALYHHFIRRDAILTRMLPGSR